MDANNTLKKNQRISKMQKQKLVEYMSSNLEFARGQFDGLNANSDAKVKWEHLKTSLNSLGGSEKSVDQWKKCWTDLKGGVKALINKRRSYMNKTGGGSWGDGPRDLTDLEEQILQIITVDAVDGDGCTQESGLTPEEPHDESMLIEILDDEILPPLPKKKKEAPTERVLKTASLYKEALDESRNMHSNLMKKLQRIEAQNTEILQKLSDIDEKLNSR